MQVFFVLLAVWLSRGQRDLLAAAAAAMAVVVRQNNIVWVAYIMGIRMLADAPSNSSFSQLVTTRAPHCGSLLVAGAASAVSSRAAVCLSTAAVAGCVWRLGRVE